MANKLMIPCLYLQSEKAVTGFGQRNLFGNGDVVDLAGFYSDNGADELLVFDFSSGDEEHEKAIGKIKEICAASEIPVMAAGNINRMEDVKKLIYAGCAKIALNFSKQSNIDLLEEMSKRFGQEKIYVCISSPEEFMDHKELIEAYAGGILALDYVQDTIGRVSHMQLILHTEETQEENLFRLLNKKEIGGLTGAFVSSLERNLLIFKEKCRDSGILVNTYESEIKWSEFTLNKDGLIPVIVQDYKTDEVLMLAYMNEEAFHTTLRTGKMTYWSRSRQELWTKGLTSGHLQYVKSLTLDCDNDTILAKVAQVGAACHTGNRTCFFQPLIKKEYDDTNPLRVFQDVYHVIQDR